MAEILIKAIDDGLGNTATWSQGCVVAVMPDGHPWGTKEGLPLFWRVIVAGATVEECLAYAQPVTDPETGAILDTSFKRLRYNTLSTPIKRQLDNEGLLTVTKAQADAYLT